MANSNTLNVEITSSVEGLKSGLSKAESSIKGFSSSTTSMTTAVNKNAKAVKVNAVPAMTSFSQVVQDAPYGIRGVANNIQQLTSQFGYLSARTGGAGSALKAMIGSLAGPAGILFAVSAVTSLLVSYGDELFKSSKQVDTNTIANQRLNDALRAQLELKQQLKDELTLATKIAVAEAKLAGKSEKEQYEITKTYAEARVQSLEIQAKEAKRIRLEAAKDAKLAKNQENEDLQRAVEKAYKDQLELEKNLKTAKAELRLADLNEQIRINNLKSSNIQSFNAETVSALTTFKATATPIANEINETLSDSIPSKDVIDAKTSALMVALADFNQQASNIISDGISNTFADLGVSIGEALSSGANIMASAGSALLGGLGTILVELGKMAIATGVGLLAIQASLKSLGGLGAIAAGVALVALGSAFSSGATSLSDSMGTSSDYSSDYSSSSSSSYGSSSSYSSAGTSGGTYVFEIAGTKLVGVLKNTLDRNKALGGSLSIG